MKAKENHQGIFAPAQKNNGETAESPENSNNFPWLEKTRKIEHNHRVLQGAAQRGGQYYFVFAVLRARFSCSKWAFSTLRLGQGNPLKHRLIVKTKEKQNIKIKVCDFE